MFWNRGLKTRWWTLFAVLNGFVALASLLLFATALPASAATVEIRPGDDLKASVAAHPEGTAFVITAGVHRGQSVGQPKDRQIFRGQPGAILDGEGAKYAFRNGADSVGVVIENLEIRNYAPGRNGAIDFTSRVVGENGFGEATGWRLSNLHVHGNQGEGIRVGSGSRLTDIRANNNTILGIGGTGRDIRIEGGETRGNGQESDPNNHGGGIKLFLAVDVSITGHTAVDNRGHGIWIDGSGRNVRIAGNTVTGNSHSGIHYEISFDGVIENNVVRNNNCRSGSTWLSGGGIYVSTSTNVRVSNNEVSGNHHGITAVEHNDRQSRRNDPAVYKDGRPYKAKDVVVEGNRVVAGSCTAEAGRSGIVTNGTDDVIYRTSTFRNNSYCGGVFSDRAGRDLSWSQWKAAGRDIGGTFDSNVGSAICKGERVALSEPAPTPEPQNGASEDPKVEASNAEPQDGHGGQTRAVPTNETPAVEPSAQVEGAAENVTEDRPDDPKSIGQPSASEQIPGRINDGSVNGSEIALPDETNSSSENGDDGTVISGSINSRLAESATTGRSITESSVSEDGDSVLVPGEPGAGNVASPDSPTLVVQPPTADEPTITSADEPEVVNTRLVANLRATEQAVNNDNMLVDNEPAELEQETAIPRWAWLVVAGLLAFPLAATITSATATSFRRR